ncbi:hypothetical protein SNE40_021141 [Patella caerulea]|uniref:Uncharacterized protein n=1 Tax=Patella caerulea TaxID=87958 RepID=A0AAN8GAI0_PATCE
MKLPIKKNLQSQASQDKVDLDQVGMFCVDHNKLSMSFEAVKLKKIENQWRNITSDRNIIDIVCHCHIEFLDDVKPVPSSLNRSPFLEHKKINNKQ